MNIRTRSITLVIFVVAAVGALAHTTLAEPAQAGRKVVFNSMFVVRADAELKTAELRLTPDAVHAITHAGTHSSSTSDPGSEWAPSPRMTAMAGIALSLALVSGGLWTMRRKVRLDARVAIPLFVGFAVLATTTLAVANMLPPSKYRGTLRKALSSPDDQLTGPIVIVVDDEAIECALVLPTNDDAGKPKP